jgi:PD-(D/E)XK nuclease superfamily protein
MSTTNLLERSMSSDMDDWPIFSYSQLQSWDRCMELWNYAYARNWFRKSKSIGLNRGTEVHLAMKEWYDMAILRVPKDERKKRMMTYFQGRINEHSDNFDMLKVIEKAMFLTMRYVNEFAPVEDKGHRILKTEYHFTVPFRTMKGRNFILQGYIDLLTEWMDKLWAWDHKTMESNFWTPVQVMMEPQTPLYTAALREQGEKVHGAIINMFNTYDYAKPQEAKTERLFSRERSYRSDREIDTFRQEMFMSVDQLIDNYQHPRRSLRLDCKNCSFQEPCLMRIKGINDLPLLEAEYEQKQKIEVPLTINPERLTVRA